ncbi:MAG TPA: hypothetical protein VH391_04650 [Solirubrobacterales bacterium]
MALGGTAVALNGQNTVQSDDLGPGAQVKAADVANNAVGGAKIIDGSVTGADISESSLGQVRSALLGGFGRSGSNSSTCDPESTQLSVCTVVTRTLPARARLLLIAHTTAYNNSLSPSASEHWGTGECQIGTTSGPLADTLTPVVVQPGEDRKGLENVSLVGITGPFPAGQHSFGLDCRETDGHIAFMDSGISTVAIAPN